MGRRLVLSLPALATRVWPSCGVPEIVGGEVLRGACWGAIALPLRALSARAESPARPAALSSITGEPGRTVPPASSS